MPTIPSYRRPTEIPRSGGARAPMRGGGGFGSAMAALGGALEKQGARLDEINRKKDEAEGLSTAQDILNESRLGVETDLDELRRSGMNSTQFQTDSRAVFEKWQEHADERGKAIKSPEAGNYLARKLGEFNVNTMVALGDEFDKKFRDEQRAGVLMNVPGIEARAIRARTPAEMESAVTELREFLGSHTNYALSAEEATKTYLASVDTIREQRIRDAVLADPVAGLNLLGSQQTTDLKPEQVDRLTRFATAQLNAQEAAERRREADETRAQKLKSKVEDNALTGDIIRGRDVTQRVLDARDLDGGQKRALLDWQRQYNKAEDSAPSDPTELLRWRIAARTGRDPSSGRPVKWTDVVKADLSSKDKGDLVDKLLDHQDAASGKFEKLHDQRRSRGDQHIRLMLSGKDGLLAQIMGGTGDAFTDLNMYQAQLEFDGLVRQQSSRDPVDIANEVVFKYARNSINKFAGSSAKILNAYNVKSVDELLNKVQSGQISREQSDQILRLGNFLKEADKPEPIAPDAPAKVDDGSGAFNAVLKYLRESFSGPGAGRSTTPTPKQ